MLQLAIVFLLTTELSLYDDKYSIYSCHTVSGWFNSQVMKTQKS